MDRAEALRRFLERHFEPPDLRGFVAAHLKALVPEIHWERPLRDLTRDVVSSAAEHRQIDEDFFDALVEARPKAELDLRDLRASWLTAGPDPVPIVLGLSFSGVVLTPPPPHSTAATLRFQLMNVGPVKVVMQRLELLVDAHRPSETLRMVELGAPIPEHHHLVELDPDTAEYDVRATTFGPPAPLLSFVQDEVESFVVELTSTQPHWYAFRLRARWYDTRSPTQVRVAESERLEVDFPPDAAQLLGLGGGS
jgi:hypothetical protein